MNGWYSPEADPLQDIQDVLEANYRAWSSVKMDEPLNHPFYEVYNQAQVLINEGATVHFKFTCDKCGSRQTFDEPNTLYKLGQCEECNHITNVEETGCGFLLIT